MGISDGRGVLEPVTASELLLPSSTPSMSEERSSTKQITHYTVPISNGFLLLTAYKAYIIKMDFYPYLSRFYSPQYADPFRARYPCPGPGLLRHHISYLILAVEVAPGQ